MWTISAVVFVLFFLTVLAANLNGALENEIPNMVPITERKAVLNTNLLWPQGKIQYSIDPAVPEQIKNWLLEAMTVWSADSCLQFKNVTGQSTVGTVLTINSTGNGCNSFVGYRSAFQQQPLNIDASCASRKKALQLIGNVIGLHPEETRNDRDSFVTINFQDVLTNSVNSVTKQNTNNYGTHYDYRSIMHSAKDAFASSPGLVTIVTKDPAFQDIIGTATELSFDDKKIVNEMYSCGSCPVIIISCDNEGYLDGGCSCQCPEGVTGAFCEIPAVCGGNVTSPTMISTRYNLKDCNWHIMAPSGMMITVAFQNFNFHPSDASHNVNCSKEYVELKTNHMTGDRYCGEALKNKTITLTGNELHIHVKSGFICPKFPGLNAFVLFQMKPIVEPVITASVSQPVVLPSVIQSASQQSSAPPVVHSSVIQSAPQQSTPLPVVQSSVIQSPAQQSTPQPVVQPSTVLASAPSSKCHLNTTQTETPPVVVTQESVSNDSSESKANCSRTELKCDGKNNLIVVLRAGECVTITSPDCKQIGSFPKRKRSLPPKKKLGKFLKKTLLPKGKSFIFPHRNPFIFPKRKASSHPKRRTCKVLVMTSTDELPGTSLKLKVKHMGKRHGLHTHYHRHRDHVHITTLSRNLQIRHVWFGGHKARHSHSCRKGSILAVLKFHSHRSHHKGGFKIVAKAVASRPQI